MNKCGSTQSRKEANKPGGVASLALYKSNKPSVCKEGSYRSNKRIAMGTKAVNAAEVKVITGWVVVVFLDILVSLLLSLVV